MAEQDTIINYAVTNITYNPILYSQLLLDLLTSKSDQHLISPDNINPKSHNKQNNDQLKELALDYETNSLIGISMLRCLRLKG